MNNLHANMNLRSSSLQTNDHVYIVYITPNKYIVLPAQVGGGAALKGYRAVI